MICVWSHCSVHEEYANIKSASIVSRLLFSKLRLLFVFTQVKTICYLWMAAHVKYFPENLMTVIERIFDMLGLHYFVQIKYVASDRY